MSRPSQPPLRSARPWRAALALGSLVVLLALPASGVAKSARPLADLRADTNRDGIASTSGRADERSEARWTSSRGAVVLPNLDDDARRCQSRDAEGRPLSDGLLAKCNDAADTKINGAADRKDLAPLRVKAWPGAPGNATATVSVDEGSRGKVRLFAERAGRFEPLQNGRLSAANLRSGVRLGIEARDVVRDPRGWAGAVGVTLTVRAGGEEATDRVRMRVAPVIFQHDLMPATRVMVAPPSAANAQGGEAAEMQSESDASETVGPRLLPRFAAGSEDTLSKMAATEGSSPDATEGRASAEDGGLEEFMALARRGEKDFLRDLKGAVSEARVPEGLQRLREPAGDIWAQDYFEPAYASMPAPEGRRQTVRIMVRSANAWPTRGGGVRLRPAGKTVYTELREPGVGAVQQVDRDWALRNGMQDTYNSTGNWGAIPPYRLGDDVYPNGRILYGSAPGNRPDPSFVRMMEAQGAQSPVVMDTSWLFVGHVDEFLSFLPADNQRGWVLAVADPRGALDVLRDARREGNGDAKLLEGLKKLEIEQLPDGSLDANTVQAERTVDEVLGSRTVIEANERAARAIETNLSRLRAETGLKESEIVRVPVLFEDLSDVEFLSPKERRKLVALVPDAVNGVHLSEGEFLSPEQHGPVVEGEDLMEEAVEKALGRAGVEVRWVEDYYYAHVGGGEVHCVTNALRDLSGEKPWWNSSP